MSSNNFLLPSERNRINRVRLIKAQANTNPNYGKNPNERNVYELLDSGFVNIDKPSGPSSHQIVAWVKEILNINKAGHGGTLDPNATGLLTIALGNATKAVCVLLLAGKEYVGIMRLHKKIEEKKLRETCKSFVGEIYQIPPLRSAVKRRKRKRHIYYLQILEIKNKDVLFRVGCEAGTYIRTLCVDIGKKLGCGAHLLELRRTKVGCLNLEDAVKLQDLKDAYMIWIENEDDRELKKIIKPFEKLFDHLPKIVVRDSAVDAICHGADLALPGVLEVDSDIKKNDLIGIFTLKGEIIALGKTLMDAEQMIQKNKGVCANIERVFMKRGTYPRVWKKS
ncbi:MAG: RNA-guided pseudouridylation complex pseudouridine synthase subunit Cbf5 [Thermoplasmata archaeon]|nr:RNA-guided pseudouridylation complex pseudouridine synthase subunit Cbf5 [Thermoplasmata archaeon]